MQHMRPANCPWWSSRACGKGGTIWASTSLLGEILHSAVSQYNYHPSLAYVLPSSNACLSTQGDKSRTRICFCANPTRMLFDFGQLSSYSLHSSNLYHQPSTNKYCSSDQTATPGFSATSASSTTPVAAAARCLSRSCWISSRIASCSCAFRAASSSSSSKGA